MCTSLTHCIAKINEHSVQKDPYCTSRTHIAPQGPTLHLEDPPLDLPLSVMPILLLMTLLSKWVRIVTDGIVEQYLAVLTYLTAVESDYQTQGQSIVIAIKRFRSKMFLPQQLAV